MLRSLGVVALVALGTIAAPAIARADDPPPAAPKSPDPKDAKRALAAGDAFMKKGDQQIKRGKTAEARASYDRALAAYTRAHELSGNPQVYYAMAAAEEKLGRNADAVRDYRRVTREVTNKPQLVDLAKARIAELAPTVGLFSATVDPLGAEIAIDGSPVGKAPLTDPLILAPGNYTITITADGYQPLTTQLPIEAGSEAQRSFRLEPVTILVQKPREAPKPIKRPKITGPSRIPMWLGVGVTVACAGIATGTGLTAMKREDQYNDTSLSLAEREDARTSGKKLALTTDILIGSAVVVAAVTFGYYVWSYRPKVRNYHRRLDDERRREPKVGVVPWVEAGGGGALAVGRF